MLIHSGSRTVGRYVGNRWMAKARESWPAGLAHHGEEKLSRGFQASQPTLRLESFAYLVSDVVCFRHGYSRKSVWLRQR